MDCALAKYFESPITTVLTQTKQCICDLVKLYGLTHLQKFTYHSPNQRTNIVVFMAIHITSNWCMYIQTNTFVIMKTKRIMKINLKRSDNTALYY